MNTRVKKIADLKKKSLQYYFTLLDAQLSLLQFASKHAFKVESLKAFLAHFELDYQTFLFAKCENKDLSHIYGAFYTLPYEEFPISWYVFKNLSLSQMHQKLLSLPIDTKNNKVVIKAVLNNSGTFTISELENALSALPHPTTWQTLLCLPIEDAKLMFAGYYDMPILEVLKHYSQNRDEYLSNFLDSQTQENKKFHAQLLKFFREDCISKNLPIPEALQLKFLDGQELTELDYLLIEINSVTGMMYMDMLHMGLQGIDFKHGAGKKVCTSDGTIFNSQRHANLPEDMFVDAHDYQGLFFTVFVSLLEPEKLVQTNLQPAPVEPGVIDLKAEELTETSLYSLYGLMFQQNAYNSEPSEETMNKRRRPNPSNPNGGD